MSNGSLALLIGGLLPAVLFGLSGAVQKTAAAAGIGPGPHLIVIGTVVVIVGAVVTAVGGDWTLTRTGGSYTALFGLLWATGVGSIAVALGRYDGQISQLVPLYNMNTLVAVVVGLVVLGEWQAVHPARLLLAAVLTIGGGVLAASSART